jgi:hypothetical protein
MKDDFMPIAGDAESAAALSEIPAAALQSEGGQQLVPFDPATVPEPEGEPLIETLADVFARWHRRFNDEDPEAAALPHEGTSSWKQAHKGIADVLAEHPGFEMAVDDVLRQARCTTRHMHAPPMQLHAEWLSDPNLVVDRENFRARRRVDPDRLENYFSVQVDDADISRVLQDALDAFVLFKGEEAPKDGAPADEVDPAWARPTPPVPPPRRQADVAGQHLEVVPERTAREEEMLPERCRLIETPDGYRAAWYGPPRATEAEAVADAWKRDRRSQ